MVHQKRFRRTITREDILPGERAALGALVELQVAGASAGLVAPDGGQPYVSRAAVELHLGDPCAGSLAALALCGWAEQRSVGGGQEGPSYRITPEGFVRLHEREHVQVMLP